MGNGRTTEIPSCGALDRALRQTKARWAPNPECLKVEKTNLLHTEKDTGLKPETLVNDGVFPPVIIECSIGARDADRDAIYIPYLYCSHRSSCVWSIVDSEEPILCPWTRW